MPYPSALHKLRDKRSDTCIIYSTKDRTKLTHQTFPALTAEGDFDLMWMDGSMTDLGRSLPSQLLPGASQATEHHEGVVGGPDAAIVYGLSRGLEAGYDNIGLVENDVLLSPGWFGALMSLFEEGKKDGFNVGATTVRPYDKRTLWHTDRYSIHFGSGAGMIMFNRDGAECVLRNYRSTTFGELRQAFMVQGGRDISKLWELEKHPLRRNQQFGTSADWYYDPALIREGMTVLGTVPGYAENIDVDVYDTMGVTVNGSAVSSDETSEAFHNWKANFQNASHSAGMETPYQYDNRQGLWIVYPHQIATLFPNAFSEYWRIKWEQTCGPFTLFSERPNETLTLPIRGTAFVVHDPKQHLQKRSLRSILLPRLVHHRWPMSHIAPITSADGQATFSFPSTGTEFKALAFREPQSWMTQAPEFRFHHIKRFFG